MLAYEIIVCFPADILLVAVPPCHPAGIGAELFLPAAFGLHQWLAAILTSFCAWDNRVAMDVRTHRSFGQTQSCGNHGRTVSLQPHIVDSDFILQSHSDTPSVMTAKVVGRAALVGHPPWLVLSSPR